MDKCATANSTPPLYKKKKKKEKKKGGDALKNIYNKLQQQVNPANQFGSGFII